MDVNGDQALGPGSKVWCKLQSPEPNRRGAAANVPNQGANSCCVFWSLRIMRAEPDVDIGDGRPFLLRV
jgi:hypothetical protein